MMIYLPCLPGQPAHSLCVDLAPLGERRRARTKAFCTEDSKFQFQPAVCMPRTFIIFPVAPLWWSVAVGGFGCRRPTPGESISSIAADGQETRQDDREGKARCHSFSFSFLWFPYYCVSSKILQGLSISYQVFYIFSWLPLLHFEFFLGG